MKLFHLWTITNYKYSKKFNAVWNTFTKYVPKERRICFQKLNKIIEKHIIIYFSKKKLKPGYWCIFIMLLFKGVRYFLISIGIFHRSIIQISLETVHNYSQLISEILIDHSAFSGILTHWILDFFFQLSHLYIIHVS